MAEDKPVDWLKQTVGRCLKALVVLHLEGGPPLETVTKTAEIWYRVIKKWPIAWNEELDKQRLEQAFLALASQCQRWPSPSQLRPLLPVRQYPAALPEPEYPEEKARANRARIKALISAAMKR